MKKFLCAILCLCVCLCASSCADKSNTAEDILGGIMNEMSEISDLPKGKIYRAGAEEGSEDYLSADTATALYGENAAHHLTLVSDFAIYLSAFAAPCEIAVFICYSASDALTIERMCRERADVLSVAMRESDLCDLKLNATIVRKGRRVAFAMTDSAPRAEKIVKKFT